MFMQFLVGGVASIVNIAAHAMFMVLVIAVVRKQKARILPGVFTLARIMMAVATVLMIAHMAEALVWALVYRFVGAVDLDHSLLYFALVNFATLGYGDITPVDDWKLLGPITSMNGILLFGWSTAVLFEVLRETMSLIEAMEEKSSEARQFQFDRGKATAAVTRSESDRSSSAASPQPNRERDASYTDGREPEREGEGCNG
jgi:hypothetical protein